MQSGMVIVLTGPMGCGKTTIGRLLSSRLGWRFADGDDFHPQANIDKMRSGMPLSDEDRYPWLRILHDQIRDGLSRGENMILACSALKKEYRKLLGINQKDVISVYLAGSSELLQRRIEARTHHYMAKDLLESQLATLQKPRSGIWVDIAPGPEEIVETIIKQLQQLNQKTDKDTMKQTIGVAGLAVMGENLVLNMASKGFSVAVYNRTYEKTERFLAGRAAGKEIAGFHEVKDFVAALESPRKIMMMLKAGSPVDQFIEQLLPYLDAGDIVIDGGNSNYQDTLRRLKYLEDKGIRFIGTGVSGGEEGALKGPSIMPGGSPDAWPHVKPIFTAAAAQVDDGSSCCAWIGADGAGHFVKMVHNGIEYGDMQLICEAYHVMKSVLGMDTAEIHSAFSRWNNGELSSYLIEITADITAYLDSDGVPLLEKILDAAGQKGTGKWTVNAALDYGVPLSLISESVFARCLSSFKDLRVAASGWIEGRTFPFEGDRDAMIDDLGKALYAAKIISYTQGFGLLQAASKEHGWNLNYADIAKIWRGGCIIRSVFLDRIAEAYNTDHELANMLLSPYFQAKVVEAQVSLRRVVGTAVMAGIPMPCHSGAISYFDGLRTASLPANLLQAQRDFFGAHMYERVDKPRGEWFHTNWTGEGGDTTSTAYTK